MGVGQASGHGLTKRVDKTSEKPSENRTQSVARVDDEMVSTGGSEVDALGAESVAWLRVGCVPESSIFFAT